MRRSLLIGSLAAAILAAGIAAAQAPYQPAARVPITAVTATPRPVRVTAAARDLGPAAAAEPQGAPYAVIDDATTGATAAYPVSVAAPQRSARIVAGSPRAAAAASEGGAVAAREGAAPGSGARGAAQAAASAEAMNGRMGRVLLDGMTSLFETCPSMARSTGIQTQKIANGISISYVSDDPVVVERLQKMADAIRLMREASSE